MEIIDTQILSFGFKKKIGLDNKVYAISSVTASEFLLIYGSDPLSANYYIPYVNFIPARDQEKVLNDEHYGKYPQVPYLTHPKWAKYHTDIYTIEFGGEFPNIREFGSQALSFLINERLLWLYDKVIHTMPKPQRKYLRKRIRYITEKGITCIPLNETIIEISFNILEYFLSKKYNPKKKFRNTYNDILILSTIIENKAKGKLTELITHDKLLNKLYVEISEIYGGIIKKEDEYFVQVDFSENSSVAKKDSKESNGYINRGWQYKERKSIII